jgi:DNA-nicking Smr family endonuclease
MKRNADIMISHEDRILWETVARTIKPIKGRSLSEFEGLLSTADDNGAESIPLTPARSVADSFQAKTSPAAPQTGPRKLDEPTHKKIAKGRVSLGARIDLHGMTQGEAHALLHAFLHRAHAEGLRHVLVITGKGSSYGSDGILRQAVPHWFATPQFRPYVSAYEDAARQHGGHGALYVRLRRATGERPQ